MRSIVRIEDLIEGVKAAAGVQDLVGEIAQAWHADAERDRPPDQQLAEGALPASRQFCQVAMAAQGLTEPGLLFEVLPQSVHGGFIHEITDRHARHDLVAGADQDPGVKPMTLDHKLDHVGDHVTTGRT